MPKVLVYEADPVFAAALEDRLHVAGYRVVMVPATGDVAAIASEESVDLIVLEMDAGARPGLELVNELRRQPETRSLAIIALADGAGSAQRVEALRAGVDDYLNKPFEVEELLLRLERLLGSRGVAPPLMQGDLENHPPWELIQYVQNGAKSGELAITGREGSGKVRLTRGQVASARFRHLRGREALIAFLGMKEGRFRLSDEDAVAASPPVEQPISLQEVLMEAVWIEDELDLRRDRLPATGASLEVLDPKVPEIDDELGRLPLGEILDAVRERPGLRPYDLITNLPTAPQKIRLGVALLVEHGALAASGQSGEHPALTTMEISSSLVLDLAVANLLGAAKNAGFDTSGLPLLVLAESGVWNDLVHLLRDAPGAQGLPVLRKLGEQLELRRGGSASFENEIGKLSLHVQVLTGSVRPQIEGIVPVCAGVVLWLDRGEERAAIEQVVRRLETARGAAIGVMIASTPEARAVAEELCQGSKRWQMSPHAPRALVGVLRLVHPRAKRS